MVKNPENAKKCLNLMFAQTKDFIFFILLSICSGLVSVAMMVLLNKYINMLTQANPNISTYVLIFIGLLIFVSGIQVVQHIAKSNIISNVRNDLLDNGYKGILYAEINELKDEKTIEAINKMVSNSNYIAQEYIGKNVLSYINITIICLILLVSTIIIQPILGLVLMIFIPFYFIVMKGINIFQNKFTKKSQEANEENEARISTSFDMISTIKLRNGINVEKDAFSSDLSEYKKTKLYEDLSNLISSKIVNIVFIGVMIAICLGLGGVLYVNGNYNINLGIFTYFALATPIIFVLVSISLTKKLGYSNIENYANEVIKLSELHTELRSEPISSFEEIHSFKVNDLNYKNNENEIILDNITFDLNKSESIGIFLKEKETKDVLFSLFTKFDRPLSGEILINNCDYSKIQTQVLRTIITSINDNSRVFDSTILDNVIYPNTFDDYHYNEALNKTGLKEIVNSLPKKDQTKLTDDILTKRKDYQDIVNRVIFANAFYKDSKIYVFNDATNDYDVSTEHLLF